MKTVSLEIDGKKIVAEEGASLLDVARTAGAHIPTLCSDKDLAPSGHCRLCLVEVQKGTRKRLVASCVYPVEGGISVKTTTPQLDKNRKLIMELLWPTAGKVAHECGVTSSRFESAMPDCNLCGLCVRYCNEVAHKNVLYFKGRGVERRVAFVPGGAIECDSCRQCWGLCTGGFVVHAHGQAALERPDE